MINKKDFQMGSSLISHDQPRFLLMFIKLQTLRPVLWKVISRRGVKLALYPQRKRTKAFSVQINRVMKFSQSNTGYLNCKCG